jgi:transmembrane sensor
MTDMSIVLDPRGGAPGWNVLARFLAGESGAGEASAVAAWLAAHPADADVLRALDLVIGRPAARETPAAAPPVDVEAALRRVQLRRDGQPPPLPARDVIPLRPRATRRLHWRVGALAAAAALGAVVVGVERRWDAVEPAARVARAAEAPVRVIRTAVGVRDSVRLPDGTRVVLAPASRLEIAAGYANGAREVRLEGAAWFAVHHDAARPFTVHAGDAVVRDIGTEFSVRADGVGPARAVAVAVTEGTVSLARSGGPASTAPVVLDAGDRAELHGDGPVVAARGTVTDADVAWTRGQLVYDSTPLDVVRADLRRWFGVELRVADATLASRRLTATFDTRSVDRVLAVIALALGAEVERAGDTVTLRRSASGGR